MKKKKGGGAPRTQVRGDHGATRHGGGDVVAARRPLFLVADRTHKKRSESQFTTYDRL